MSDQSTLERLHRHFAEQLGCSPAQLAGDGIDVVAAERRSEGADPVWALVRDKGLVVSVSPDAYERAERLIERSFPTPSFLSPEGRERLRETLAESGRVWCCGQGYQYYCECNSFRPHSQHAVRRLGLDDLPWLQEAGHFLAGQKEPLERGDVFAVVQEGRVVSYAIVRRDSDLAWEIAVATEEPHRGCGYAKSVVSAATQFVHDSARIPVYACDTQNVASRRVADALGYQKYADDFFCVGTFRR